MAFLRIGPPADAKHFLMETRLLAGLPSETVEELLSTIEWGVLPGGEVLFARGDSGDSLYLVASGRLRVERESVDGSEFVVREVGRGENVGELAMLTGDPRAATVRAVRDTVLARLSQQIFDQLVERHPKPMLQLTRMLARWLGQHQHSPARSHNIATVAIVSFGRVPSLPLFLQHLLEVCGTVGATLHLNASRVDAFINPHASLTIESDDGYSSITKWLNDQENSHRFVIYEGTSEDSPWTRRCIRQADRIIVVAHADTSSPGNSAPRELLKSVGQATADAELVLLHDGPTNPRGTAQWTALSKFIEHHHVQSGSRADVERVVRHLTGRAVGLVLGGGGVRAFAHVGVIRALEEANVPIDRLGGTSAGAYIGAQYAYGYDLRTLAERSRMEWRGSSRDYTLPLIALLSGRGPARALEAAFGDGQIDDLRIPFFCVSANLTRAELTIHREGSIARAVLASMAMPGVFPPVALGTGDLLVDGAVLNNLPVDVMRRLGDGPIIAVDVSPRVDMLMEGNSALTPSPWQILRSHVTGSGPARSYPNILRILSRSTSLQSAALATRARNESDLYLAPPVQEFDMFDWRALQRIADVGYEYANRRIAEWQYRNLAETSNVAPNLTNDRG